jgi:broad specificity phosphatase PhoE
VACPRRGPEEGLGKREVLPGESPAGIGSLVSVDAILLARHGESRFSVRAAVNGAPDACGGLTDAGREQARELGDVLAAEPIELCVVTEFARTGETAELALAGRHVPRLVVPELNDIGVGAYEGSPLEEYRIWAWSAAAADEGPGGAESRAAAAARYADALRIVLARPERLALVVAHALPIRYVLDAAAGSVPAQRVDPVEYARPVRLTAADLRRAARHLESWCERPVFA